MKYIIFKDKNQILHPVLFGEHTNHVISFENMIPVNGGFVDITVKGLVIREGFELLKLKTGERDIELLNNMFSNLSEMFFFNKNKSIRDLSERPDIEVFDCYDEMPEK